MSSAAPPGLRRLVAVVAAANLAYFGIEFAVARHIGSVSLFADSIDFLEDAAVSLLVLLAVRWPARDRARVGFGLAALLLVPGIATVVTIVAKFGHPAAPAAGPLALTALGALVVNGGCAMLLARYRTAGSLTRAAFLSARNDAAASIAIVAAGAVTAATGSFLPDLIVGIGIALLNADAAREVFVAARTEHAAA